jgi:hypothetical protein
VRHHSSIRGRVLIVVAMATLGCAFTKLIGQQESARGAGNSPGPQQDDPEALHKRLSGKVERVKEGVKKWEESGRDPSAILKRMAEKVGPLLDSGKPLEAEAELDRVLKALGQESDGNPEPAKQKEQSFSTFPRDRPRTTVGNLGLQLIFHSVDSPVARIQSKLNAVQKLGPEWARKGGDAAKLQALMLNFSRQGDRSDFVGAEKTIDEILSLLGAKDISLADASLEMHRKEREGIIADARRLNLTGIEDYVGWAVVEPERGTSNWGTYREDAVAIRKAGVKFVPFLWIQSLPRWVKDDSRTVYTSNVGTGRETGALSIFAPATHEAYDRFFGKAKRELGELVDILRIGSPYDFGEMCYPAAAASAHFPMKNLEPGFWVNEAPARAHFKAAIEKKYGTVGRLNTAWGTSFATFEAIDYPRDIRSPRYWLDFIHWYQDGFTEMMGKIAAIARKHFPEIPININIGMPYEKVNLGQDITGLAKIAAEKGISVRTPTGMMVPFLMTKRVATAARHYRPPYFSSEPAGGSASCEQMALAFFADLTNGVNWHFDYGSNYDRCQESFAAYRRLWSGSEYPRIDTALFFTTTAHFLENWDNWRPAGFNGGFPGGLQEYAEALRDRIDYDVVDERLISDGFLASYRFLIWPRGTVAEADTLRKIKAWVQDGGTLLIAGLEDIRTVERDSGAFEGLANLPATGGVRQVGKGRLIEIAGGVQDLDGKVPAGLDARDGVLVSAFKAGTLVFNRTDRAVMKTFSVKGIPTEITLEPFEFRWIGQ